MSLMVNGSHLPVRQVKQTLTAAGYEKMVLRTNAWMVKQGYETFWEVVEVSPKRYSLELCVRRGRPCVPKLKAVIEFLIGMSTGDVLKGGDRDARHKDWYASPMWGKTHTKRGGTISRRLGDLRPSSPK